MALRGTNWPPNNGASQAVTPAVTAMTKTPATQPGARSAPAPTAPSPSTSSSASIIRGSSRMWHQTAAPQGARLRVNQPSTSHTAVQLLEVINEVTKVMQEEELLGADLVELIERTVKKSPE